MRVAAGGAVVDLGPVSGAGHGARPGQPPPRPRLRGVDRGAGEPARRRRHPHQASGVINTGAQGCPSPPFRRTVEPQSDAEHARVAAASP